MEQKSIHRIHESNQALFRVLTESEQAAFCRFFSGFSLSLQAQREFLEWIPEIASASEGSVEKILDDHQVRCIIGAADLNQPQKIQHIRKRLFALRFPEYSKVLHDWEHCANVCNPDKKSVRFIAPAGFEKQRLEVHLTIESVEQVRTILSGLNAISDDQWNKLIAPLNAAHVV